MPPTTSLPRSAAKLRFGSFIELNAWLGERCRVLWTEVRHTSEHFQQLLKEHGITCSMSRAGEVWDNSAMESFFSSLKIERTARKVYRTREQARADVFDYIERFYNRV